MFASSYFQFLEILCDKVGGKLCEGIVLQHSVMEKVEEVDRESYQSQKYGR